mmetsp:Transcript_54144/g.153404  ORF Transcript_54144/g.153404 Transcript_54144/m.153404 type:complete len:241 (+) Transcript_54144:661-1383(+)
MRGRWPRAASGHPRARCRHRRPRCPSLEASSWRSRPPTPPRRPGPPRRPSHMAGRSGCCRGWCPRTKRAPVRRRRSAVSTAVGPTLARHAHPPARPRARNRRSAAPTSRSSTCLSPTARREQQRSQGLARAKRPSTLLPHSGWGSGSAHNQTRALQDWEMSPEGILHRKIRLQGSCNPPKAWHPKWRRQNAWRPHPRPWSATSPTTCRKTQSTRTDARTRCSLFLRIACPRRQAWTRSLG